MNVLLAHNHYQQAGGEDEVFAAEAALLEAHGHCVHRYVKHNDAVAGMNPVRLAAQTVWNGAAYREVRALLRREGIDVVHAHNTLPLISPALYHAAHAEGVPVVQTLHNYRLLCPSGLLMREGAVCEACVGKAFAADAVRHACYRGSRPATAAVASMLSVHRALGTWREKVDVYIALTAFGRQKFIEGGLPSDRVVVKPNFIREDPGVGGHQGGYALFVGRLSEEKGVDVLVRAWHTLGERVPLKIVGDGPAQPAIRTMAAGHPGIEMLGRRTHADVLALMQGASFLVVPSRWYEPFGLILVEAFATGLPVVASNLGSMASIVEHGRTGLHFTSGDPSALAAAVSRALDHPEAMKRMQQAARAEYEAKYTAERNYQVLMDIYRQAIERRSGASIWHEAA